ncbi:MAG: ABC transporter substrate-binding protein [Acidobacteria bacterium]|nr:ABC transporter substrate-binding protein [Acidobacteriota bacterium]
MRAQLDSYDPREITNDSSVAASAEKLLSLAFERLVRLDNTGRPQPQLALSWQTDVAKRHWEFRLRPGVKSHDGTAVTPATAVGALQRQWGNEFLMSVSGETLVIESKQPIPDLLERLAFGRSYIFAILRDGTLAGTGPFRLAGWQPRQRAVFVANEDHWGGRPFLDKLEVQMGVSLTQQVVDFELGKADLIELAPDQLRRAARDGVRIWMSSPIELLAIGFPREGGAEPDLRVRQALALAVDRTAIQTVLLQKQGEVAGGLLPQWLSGYAFLFPSAVETERARTLLKLMNPAPPPLVLEYDGTDLLARAIAERVSLDASQVGLKLRAVQAGPALQAAGKLRLLRVRLESLIPNVALSTIVSRIFQVEGKGEEAANTPEQLYAMERKLIDSYRVVPLAHVAETYGLSPFLRNWMPTRWGVWRLEDAWLALPEQPVDVGVRP